MLQFEGWKKSLVMLVCLLGLAYAIPNVIGERSFGNFLPGKSINLGLDLQGGSHLLLQVDSEAVQTERLESIGENLRLSLREARIRFKDLNVADQRLSFALRNVDDAERGDIIVRDALSPDYQVLTDGAQTTISFTEEGIANLQTSTVEQSIEIIRRRLDPDGTKEPVIQRQGASRILVQLPGVENPEEVKRLLGRTAKLTFQLVDLRTTAEEARRSGRVPPGSVLMQSASDDDQYFLIEKRVMVSGETLETATAGFDQNSQPAVNFGLNALGARKFGKVTGENIGRPFAIVLDGKVVSAPTIQSQIFGQGQITGNFSVAETNELALILRAGALPAPLVVLEERSIGPGLGADSIAAGQIASVVGLILVVVYMIASYGLFGVFGVTALGINIILILGALSAIQATLTLPGIAGIVLTMGMAVDANVLVFERIREEIRRGRSASAAIEAGYSRAISTIIDSNLTTLFAALFLYIFGSGPIRGFSVTLSLGIITSMFTAIMVTRLLIIVWLNRSRAKTILL
ncbi:MAG: protein translocase subunit SecD [Candidatus Puniceispirillaceae bacterium]